MLYAVIMRFDSLREITASLLAETHKLAHTGITFKISRSTLADANKRRPEIIFESIYRDLYTTYHHVLSSDSRSHKTPKWMKRLQIIDSTTITLFSNLLFKGVGRHPKTGKKKGDSKVHTSALNKGDIMAMDRAYIYYAKFRQLTERGVIYVTKMKKNLKYTILSDTMYQSPNGLMEVRWVTLIANLLLMVMQKGLKRHWSFSGLATMVIITLMYYVDFHSLFNNSEKEWEIILSEASGVPPQPSLFD